MNYKTLCGDCLAEVLLRSKDELIAADEALMTGNALCHCGGDVCDCPSCLATLNKLNAGVRDHHALGLQRPIGDRRWTPVRGLHKL